MASAKVKRLLKEFDLAKESPIQLRPARRTQPKRLTKTQLKAIERAARKEAKNQKRIEIEKRKLEKSIRNLTGQPLELNYKNDYSHIEKPILTPLKPASRFVKRLMIKRHI